MRFRIPFPQIWELIFAPISAQSALFSAFVSAGLARFRTQFSQFRSACVHSRNPTSPWRPRGHDRADHKSSLLTNTPPGVPRLSQGGARLYPGAPGVPGALRGQGCPWGVLGRLRVRCPRGVLEVSRVLRGVSWGGVPEAFQGCLGGAPSF